MRSSAATHTVCDIQPAPIISGNFDPVRRPAGSALSPLPGKAPPPILLPQFRRSGLLAGELIFTNKLHPDSKIVLDGDRECLRRGPVDRKSVPIKMCSQFRVA
jgi:hypothetical protein